MPPRLAIPRHNNFDAIRLVAAISVMFSHAFLIAEGSQRHEPLIVLTGNQAILGLCGVFVFFAISGFLVTQSFEQTGDPMRFLVKRALRIFPGLFAALVLSAFVLAPIVSTLEPAAYFSTAAPYEYVLANTLLSQMVHELPGVRFVANPVGLEINGSMWTLRFEFLMYLMVLALGALRLLRLPVILGLLALGMACLQFAALRWLGGWGWLLGFFVVGMVLYRLRATRIYDGRVAIIALAGLVLSVPIGQFIPLFPLFGCYLALWLALNPRLPVIPAARFGDLSYGIYIYGWPVEATAIWLLGGHAAWWQVFLLALPVTAVLAFLSWHLIERPALSFKPIGRRTIGRSPSAWPQARREGRHRALLHRQLPGQNAAKVKHDPKGSKGAKEENADRVGSPSAFSETSPMSAPQLADRVDFANT